MPIFKRPMNPVVAKRSKKLNDEIAPGTRVLISALQKCKLQLNPANLLTTIVVEYRGNLYMLGQYLYIPCLYNYVECWAIIKVKKLKVSSFKFNCLIEI